MKFKYVLEQYEFMLEMMDLQSTNNRKCADYLAGASFANQQWFREMKYLCKDFPKKIHLSEDEAEKYIDTETKEKASYKLEYRGEVIPIWVDDAGQQFYTIFEGNMFTTGSYPRDIEITLTDQLDSILDKYYINS